GITLAAVPFAALGLMGTNVSEVVTVSWGQELGPIAYYLANLFALFAMMTSFLAIGYTTMRNVLDIFHWPQHGWQRAVASHAVASGKCPARCAWWCSRSRGM